MGEYYVPLLIAVAAITLTYVFCLRPMRRHAGGASSAGCTPGSTESDTSHEIAALGRDIEALRQSMTDPVVRPPRRSGQADIAN